MTALSLTSAPLTISVPFHGDAESVWQIGYDDNENNSSRYRSGGWYDGLPIVERELAPLKLQTGVSLPQHQ